MAYEAGKGSGQRPSQVPRKQIDSNWDLAFGKKKNTEVKETNPLESINESVKNTDDNLIQ